MSLKQIFEETLISDLVYKKEKKKSKKGEREYANMNYLLSYFL